MSRRMDKSINLVEGDTLELDCAVWGWPSPNVTWRRRDAFSGAESDLTPATVVQDAAQHGPESESLVSESPGSPCPT